MESRNLVLITQFCLHHQVEPSLISSFYDFGLIQIVELDNENYIYSDELVKVEKIIRLYEDLGINLEGIDVINTLLDQIEVLKQELLTLNHRLAIFAPKSFDDDNNQPHH